MVKAICVEVCLPVINDVMGSNARVVFLPPPHPVGSSLPSLHGRQKEDLSGCVFTDDLILFKAACAVFSM